MKDLGFHLRRLSVGAAFICAASAVAAGCGGNSEDAYCAALKKDQGVFADDTSGLALIDNLPRLSSLADKAPDDLEDEWQSVLGALDALAQAIKDAGVKPGDFVDGQPPAGLSAQQRTKIAQAASEVSDQDVVDAFSGIDQQARDVCKLQLGL